MLSVLIIDLLAFDQALLILIIADPLSFVSIFNNLTAANMIVGRI